MKVKYIGATDEQVNFGSNDDPRGILSEDKIYQVTRREVHTWHTKLSLEEFPGLNFNSVCFEEAKE